MFSFLSVNFSRTNLKLNKFLRFKVGQHNAKRFSHGHAMIIDPWGKVLADCGGVRDCRDDNDDDDNEDICGVVKVASIDLERLRKVRREMPIWNHRRKDVYGQIQAKFRGEEEKNDETRTDISEAEGEISKDSSANNEGNREFRFGADVVLSAGVVFAETPLSFAFVNRKPVLPGHVLVAPKRLVSRMKEVLRKSATSGLMCNGQPVIYKRSRYD